MFYQIKKTNKDLFHKTVHYIFLSQDKFEYLLENLVFCK